MDNYMKKDKGNKKQSKEKDQVRLKKVVNMLLFLHCQANLNINDPKMKRKDFKQFTSSDPFKVLLVLSIKLII